MPSRPDPHTIESLLRSAAPNTRVVPPRYLRRVLAKLELRSALGSRAVYRLALVVDRKTAEEIFRPEENVVSTKDRNVAGDDPLILFARPDPERLADRSAEEILQGYTRRLFHAVYRTQARPILEDRDPNWLSDLLGMTAYDEARSVLIQEGLLLEPYRENDLAAVFAATYFELLLFAQDWLEAWFPAIEAPERLAAALRPGLPDPEQLAARVRLGGGAAAPAEVRRAPTHARTAGDFSAGRDSARVKLLKRWAEDARKRGNDVRAAILSLKQARSASASERELLESRVRGDLNSLARRLKSAIGSEGDEASAWRRGLGALIERAAQGFWPPETRWLYAIQKACTDREREFYALQPVRWLFTLGRAPLRRRLGSHGLVAMTRHLRSARRRLARTRIDGGERSRLEMLLDAAIERAEDDLRERFRPLITKSLETALPAPEHAVEIAGRAKITEELLDTIAERGFIQVGDARDAIARNALKLRDLEIPIELFVGEPLLRLDQALARSLDEVYRPAEIYMKALQKGCSIAFGTRLGRWLTRYVALPFGGSYVALSGVQHLLDLILRLFGGSKLEFVNGYSLGGSGLFVIVLMELTGFRRFLIRALRRLGSFLRWLLVDALPEFWRAPWVRRFREATVVRAVWSYILKPLIPACLALPLFARAGAGTSGAAIGLAGLWVFCSLALNSRLGEEIEEIAGDAVLRVWQRIGVDFVPGLFRFLLEVFAAIVELIDRLLHAGDEWLHFRAGESRALLGLKAALLIPWGVISYIIRIYVNILIEPQINPIKHFPVVTVSHKIMLPFLPRLTRLLAAPFAPIIGGEPATAFAGTTVLLLPGAFGFLVWELKENWRLYAANRPRTLKPAVIGRHGETMVRLLKPGFHSGTIPKRFARLRGALREHYRTEAERSGAIAARVLAIHEVESEIRKFLERDLIALFDLRGAPGLDDFKIESVELATNRVLVVLACERFGPIRLGFEMRLGVLSASVQWPEEFEDDPAAKALVAQAIEGLCALSGAADLGGTKTKAPAWGDWSRLWDDDSAEAPGSSGAGDSGRVEKRGMFRRG